MNFFNYLFMEFLLSKMLVSKIGTSVNGLPSVNGSRVADNLAPW